MPIAHIVRPFNPQFPPPPHNNNTICRPSLRQLNLSLPQTTLFGVTHPSPILLAPIGTQGILHEDGELATARAAQALGIPMILSGAASRSLEAVAQANGTGHRWFQLYW